MAKGCSRIIRLLDPYMDNELGQDKVELVKSHLGGCGCCRSELNSIQKLRGMLKESAAEGASLPDFVMANYWKGVEAKLAKKQSWRLSGLSEFSEFFEWITKLFPSPTVAFRMGAVAVLLLVVLVGSPFMFVRDKNKSPQLPVPAQIASVIPSARPAGCVVASIRSVNPNTSVMVLPTQKEGQMTVIWVFGLNNEEKRVKEEEPKCLSGEEVLM